MALSNWYRFTSGANITASKLNDLQDLIASNIYYHVHDDDQAPKIWADFMRLNTDALNYGLINSVLEHVRDTSLHNTGSSNTSSFDTVNRMGFAYIAAADWEWKDYFWEATIDLPENLYNDDEYTVNFQAVYPGSFTDFYSKLNPNANFSSLEGVVPLNNTLLDYNIMAHSLKSDGFKVRMQHIGMGDRYNIIGRSERTFMGSAWNGGRIYDGTFLYPAQIQALDDRLYVSSKGNAKISILSTVDGGMIDVIDPPEDFLGDQYAVIDINGFAVSVYKNRGVVRYACLVSYNIVEKSTNKVHQFVYLFDGDRSGLVKSTAIGFDGAEDALNTYYVNFPESAEDKRYMVSIGTGLDGNSDHKLLRIPGASGLSYNTQVDSVATENYSAATWNAPLLYPDITGDIPDAGAALEFKRSSEFVDIVQTNTQLLMQRNRAFLSPQDSTSAASQALLKQWIVNNMSSGGSPDNVSPDGAFTTPWGTVYGMTSDRSSMIAGIPYIDLKKSRVSTVSALPVEDRTLSDKDSESLFYNFPEATPEQLADHLNWEQTSNGKQYTTLHSTRMPRLSDGDAVVDPVIVVKATDGNFYEIRPNDSARYIQTISDNNGNFSYWAVSKVEKKKELVKKEVFSYNTYITYDEGTTEVQALLNSATVGNYIAYLFTGVSNKFSPTTAPELESSGDVIQWIPNQSVPALESMSANVIRNYRRMLDNEDVGTGYGLTYSGFTAELLKTVDRTSLNIDWKWVEAQGSAIAKIANKWRYYPSSREDSNILEGGIAKDPDRGIVGGTAPHNTCHTSLSGVKFLVDNGKLNFILAGCQVGDLVAFYYPAGTHAVDRVVAGFASAGDTGDAYGTAIWLDSDLEFDPSDGYKYAIFRGYTDSRPYAASNLLDWFSISDNISNTIEPISIESLTLHGYTTTAGTDPKIDLVLCKNNSSIDTIILPFIEGEYWGRNNADATKRADLNLIFKRNNDVTYRSLDFCGIYDKFERLELVDIAAGLSAYYRSDVLHYHVTIYLSDQLNNVVHVYRTKNSIADCTSGGIVDLSELLSSWVQDSDTVLMGIMRGQAASDEVHARYYGDKYSMNPDVIPHPSTMTEDANYNFWYNDYNTGFWFHKQRLNAWEGDMTRAARYNIIGDALIENADYRNGISTDSLSPIRQMGFLVFTKPLTYSGRETIGDAFTVDPRYVEEMYMTHPNSADYADALNTSTNTDITEYTCYSGKIIHNAFTLMDLSSKKNSYCNSFFMLNNSDTYAIDLYLDLGQSLYLPTYFSGQHALNSMVASGTDYTIRYSNGSRYVVPTKDTAGAYKYGFIDKAVDPDDTTLEQRIAKKYTFYQSNTLLPVPAVANAKYDNMLNFKMGNYYPGGSDYLNINLENFRLAVALPVGKTYADYVPSYSVDEEVKSGLNWLIFDENGKVVGGDDTVWFTLDWNYVNTNGEEVDSSTLIRFTLLLNENFRNLIAECSDLNGLPPGCSIPYTPSFRFDHQWQSPSPITYFTEDPNYDSITQDSEMGALGAYSPEYNTIAAPGGVNSADAKYLNTVKIFNHPQPSGGLWVSMVSPPLRLFPRYIHPYVFRSDAELSTMVGEYASSYFAANTKIDLLDDEAKLDDYIAVMLKDYRYYQILRAVATRIS